MTLTSIRPFDAAAFAFACFWAEDELQRDLDILHRCGRIAERARAEGDGTPAGWFRRAADSYVACDAVGVLAKRTCLLVAQRFTEGRPS